MKTTRRISGALVGLVFFIAGLLKLMDPVGTGLIVGEYLKFFHLDFLSFATTFFGEALALAETLTGAALITGFRPKIAAWASGILLGVFTAITLDLLIFNPSMSCGCFGEAIHLTHAQSFIKNVVLDLLWLLAFVPFVEANFPRPRKLKTVGFGIAAVSSVAFMVFFLFSIPALDFTPFSPGTDLARGYESISDNAPILSFSDARGEYDDSLALNGRLAVVSVYEPDRIDDDRWSAIGSFVRSSERSGMNALILVASAPELIAGQLPDPSLSEYCRFADRRTLMTLNRSNGGATMICDGQIVTKWAARALPDEDELARLSVAEAPVAVIEENAPRRNLVQGFLLYVFAVMLLL